MAGKEIKYGVKARESILAGVNTCSLLSFSSGTYDRAPIHDNLYYTTHTQHTRWSNTYI